MDKYLKILWISYWLSLEEIKKKYKKLCMEYHPDRNAWFKEEATKKMKEINGAYEYIIDNFEIYRQHTSNNYEQYSNNQWNKGTTKCPYCDEEIKINAKKCKHCWEWLNDNIPDEREYENKTDDGFNSNRLSPWEKKIIIWLIIIIIFFIINKYTNLIKDKIRFWILSWLIISRFFEEYTEYESLNTSIPYWKWSLKKMLKSRLAIWMLIMLVAIWLCLIIY
jgi:curved DNA-binding protein CbpA